MAKKGGAVSLQIDVDNDEDWETLIKRPGLILADIYSGWCGPCTGMIGNLRKVKLEIGGDTLTLATAKCDNITCLTRFRNKSRPTWMFIADKRMLYLMFGSNAPKLNAIIMDEINKTRAAIAEGIPREGIDFDQLTEEEQAIIETKEIIRKENERLENEAREREINEHREIVAKNLLNPLKEYNIVIMWPHVPNDGQHLITAACRETGASQIGKAVRHLITETDLHEILACGTWEFTELEKQELYKDNAICYLFQFSLGNTNEEQTNVVDIFLEKIYGSMKQLPGDKDSLAMKVCNIIKVEKEIISENLENIEDIENHEEPELQENVEKMEEVEIQNSEESENLKETENIQEPENQEIENLEVTENLEERKHSEDCKPESFESSHKNSSLENSHTKNSQDDNFVNVIIPGVYVPENEKCKVLALRILFPNITIKFDLPESPPNPPHLILAYDAFKKHEVLQVAADFPEATMRYGFFTSADAENAKLICKTGDQYDELPNKSYDAKLIVQVSKENSEPLESYIMLEPVYMSFNGVIGAKESAIFFPKDYDEPEIDPEPVPIKKKSKKRNRGSKPSNTSSTPKSESGEGVEEGLESVVEGEAEGDGECEDEGEIEEDADETLDTDNAEQVQSSVEDDVGEDKATSTVE